MEITTIESRDAETFTHEVNLKLKLGWELHGEAHISTVAEINNWDGRAYSRSVTTFVQILKK